MSKGELYGLWTVMEEESYRTYSVLQKNKFNFSHPNNSMHIPRIVLRAFPNTYKDNCIDDQDFLSLVIIYFILTALMFDTVEGNRSSRPRVISPEVISPETWVMLPEILVMSPEKKKIKSPEETNIKKIRISDCNRQ